MKKIPSMFIRDFANNPKLVTELVTPGCEWVGEGEGVATLKIDGTACMFRGGILYKRYDAKQGRTPPAGFEACEENPDPNTGHYPGWVPVDVNDKSNKFHVEAWEDAKTWTFGIKDGTYELVGPKIQGNLYMVDKHRLWPHGWRIDKAPRTYDGLKEWFKNQNIEGLVWYHADGRRCKIKRSDFGYSWGKK